MLLVAKMVDRMVERMDGGLVARMAVKLVATKDLWVMRKAVAKGCAAAVMLVEYEVAGKVVLSVDLKVA